MVVKKIQKSANNMEKAWKIKNQYFSSASTVNSYSPSLTLNRMVMRFESVVINCFSLSFALSSE
jgi:hypothetical protein